MVFEEKYFSSYVLLSDQFILEDCFHFMRYWAMCVCCNYLLTRLWTLNFEINVIFLIKSFLLHDQNVKTNS